jgi:ABC-type glycerol-3-phosphate transport system substrate-binding protein
MFKYLIIGVIAFAILSAVLFLKFGPSLFKKEAPPTASELTIWGLWEDEGAVKPALEEYKKTHPNLTIKYEYQSSLNYRSRTQTKIAADEGPDILMIHNTWTPMFLKSNSLAAAPAEVVGIDAFMKEFNPVVTEDFTNYRLLQDQVNRSAAVKEGDKPKVLQEQFVKNGKIYGMPRGIDGLAMYVNTDILQNVGGTIPTTWNEFKDTAFKATVIDDAGVIQTSGAAIGLTGNVDHWSDIVGLLFQQQPGAKIEAPNDQNGGDVLKFYTDFVRNKDQKTWDSTMPPSTQSFASGKVLFYFAPSWRAHELRQLNPELKFQIYPVPQLASKKVAWANYWGYGVSSHSKFQKDAWELVKFLTSEEVQRSLYQQASNNANRLFGLPYSNVNLQKQLVEDPLVGAFIIQAPYYKSWYLASNTKDQGIDDEMIKYFEDAVNLSATGGDPRSALDTTKKGIDQILDKYINPNAAVTPSPK